MIVRAVRLSRRPWRVGLILGALALMGSGCAGQSRGPMQERIGGTTRLRGFASPTAYEAYLRAEVAVARRELTEALRQLQLAEMADPSDPWPACRRVEILDGGGHPDEADRLLTELLGRFPTSSLVWLTQAQVTARRGHREEAFAQGRRALELDPGDPDVRAAVTQLAGGTAVSVAAARQGAPDAAAGDRHLAEREALGPSEVPAHLRHAQLRVRAGVLRARGQWRAVDRLLTSAATRPHAEVLDRISVIEARARDGRPRDAAPLVAGLRVGTTADAIDPFRHARLWLLADRADLALEELRAARGAGLADALAPRIEAEALLRLGRTREALAIVLRWPVDAPDDPLAPGADGSWAGGADPVTGPGVSFTELRLLAAAALRRADLGDAAMALYASTLRALVAPEQAMARDRVRTAWAEALSEDGLLAEARGVTATMETPYGRHRRAALLAHDSAPGAHLDDLRVRSSDPHEDGLADAWRALLCADQNGAGCTPDEARTTLEAALREAPEAPVTWRAQSLAHGASPVDHTRAREMAQRALWRDPFSPWNARLARRLGLGARGQTP